MLHGINTSEDGIHSFSVESGPAGRTVRHRGCHPHLL